MKSVLPAILCAALLLTSCDFFRKVASRPSGEEVSEAFAAHNRQMLEEAVRAEIEAAIADSLAREDSIAREEQRRLQKKFEAEARALARLEEMGVKVCSAVSRESFPDNAFDAKYGVVIGIFRYPPYAKALYDRAIKAGADAFSVKCENKLTAVLAGKSDSLDEIIEIVEKFRGKSFFPADAWVVSNSELEEAESR